MTYNVFGETLNLA